MIITTRKHILNIVRSVSISLMLPLIVRLIMFMFSLHRIRMLCITIRINVQGITGLTMSISLMIGIRLKSVPIVFIIVLMSVDLVMIVSRIRDILSMVIITLIFSIHILNIMITNFCHELTKQGQIPAPSSSKLDILIPNLVNVGQTCLSSAPEKRDIV